MKQHHLSRRVLSLVLVFSFIGLPFVSHAASWTERQPAGDTDREWRSVASDSDGSNLIAVSSVLGGGAGRIYTSTDSGANWTERQPAGDTDQNWFSVASDADGSNLIVVTLGGRIYTSSNGGVDWTESQPAGDVDGQWFTVASDADGSNLVAANYGGRIYTSSNSGVDWTERQPAGDADEQWQTVASDADGSNLIAAWTTGRLYTSSDGGANWTERQPFGDDNHPWSSVASDSDGSNLFAAVSDGRLYTSDDGGATWSEEQPVGATNKIWTAVASDADGSNLIAGIGAIPEGGRLYTSPDGVPPELAFLAPEDDATAVSVDGTFEIIFDVDVATSTGNITLHKTSDDSLIETIDVAGPKVTRSGSNAFTVNPSTTLTTNTEYYFLVDAGAIEDLSGNAFAGISDATIWSFTTSGGPSVVVFNPADNATDVSVNGIFKMIFSGNIQIGTGTITLKRTSNNATVEVITVPSSNVSLSDASTLAINPSTTLALNRGYYFLVDAGVVTDLNNNPFVGIASPTTWNFTTERAIPTGLRSSGGGSSSAVVDTTSDVETTADSTTVQPLVEQLQVLVQELVAAGGTVPTEAERYVSGGGSTGQTRNSFLYDLQFGDSGPDVTKLQEFLIKQNVGSAAQALIAVGATGFFGPLTQSAVAEYQASVGIAPVAGYFGPRTRAYVNEVPVF